jgi:serine/threonine protein kinase
MLAKGTFLPLARAAPAETGHLSSKSETVPEIKPGSRPLLPKSQAPSHTRYKYKIDNIDSLSTFVNHLNSFPTDCFEEYGASDETIRRVYAKSRSFFVGKGLSFSVSITSERQLSRAFIERWPQKALQKHQVIATKVPRLEPENGKGYDLAGLKAYPLRAVAWECHCLFHPPIQRSKHIVDLLSLAWTPVESLGGRWLFVPALVMEYADEGTLDDLLQCGEGTVPFDLKMKLGLDVALGLETLHRSGLVHADLKANNVLLFRHGSEVLMAKISDFGCAVHDFGPQETVDLPPYWPRWDAPEARLPPRRDAPEARPRRAAIDVEKVPLVDVYCFGLLIWQLILDGKTPFDRGREPWPTSDFASFTSIIHAVNDEERKAAISDLKDRADDEFLRIVKLTIKKQGFLQGELDDILSCTLRRDPDHRRQMTQIINECFSKYHVCVASFCFVAN